MKTIHLFIRVILIFILPAINHAQAETKNDAEKFDHDKTGYFLSGQHINVSCESCHVRGIFSGTPKTCDGCHNLGSQIASSVKPINHVQTRARCDDCHTENAWSIVRMDHSEFTGSCYSCHNGVKATGKPNNHVVSSNECDNCHLTVAWAPARFDHSNVTGTCYSCHNGTTAMGKHPQHIQSSNTCDDCHSTRAWTPAGFDHNNITGSCSSCHNGSTAEGKDSGHFVTTLDCDNCHRTTAWEPTLTYSHTSADYPGNHTGSRPDCNDCHTDNNQNITYRYPQHGTECAACHAGDYRTGPHEGCSITATTCNGRAINGFMDCAGTCHKSSPEHRVSGSEW